MAKPLGRRRCRLLLRAADVTTEHFKRSAGFRIDKLYDVRHARRVAAVIDKVC